MNATTKVNSREITPNLTCKLCNGYFIDATTIIECLHSFCKSCIVKHLEKSEYCPICDVQLHSSKPLSSIRSDQMLQEVVYKLVPGLFQNEMQRRRTFYQENAEAKPVSQVDSGHVYNESYITSDDIIHLSLEYFTNDIEFRKSTRRFIKCPAAVSISILKKLIQGKYDLGNEARIEVMYGERKEENPLTKYTEKERILPDDFLLMDIAYKYSWTQNGKPLQLCYRVKGPSSVFKPVITSNPTELITSDSTSKGKVKINGKSSLKKNRQSRATGTNTSGSPCINTNGIMHTPTRQIVTNGILNGQTSTSKGSQTPNGDATTTVTPRGRKKKKAALVEANNQTDLTTNGTPKMKSKVKSNLNKAGTKVDTKEKEVQLRISENGVIEFSVLKVSDGSKPNTRNVISGGEEKLIRGANNNIIGPTTTTLLPLSSSSSPIFTNTTIISPATAALAASPIINLHTPTTSNNNEFLSSHLTSTPGGRINNNSLVNKVSNLNSTILPNAKQQQQQHGIVGEGNFKTTKLQQKNSSIKPVSLSRKKFQNIQGTPGIPPQTSIPTTPINMTPTVSGKKKKDGNSLGNKVVKLSTATKRKLVNSSTNVNGPTSGSKNGVGISNNMETLKSVTKRLKEELETKGMNYFSAEITPIINGTPSPKTMVPILPDGQHFSSHTVCSVIPPNVNSNIMMGNKRLQHQSSTNGDGKYTTTPTKKKNLVSSPNTKIFPKSSNNSPSSNDRQKNNSPSVSPKKPPKFFKSRHNTADANTTTSTFGSCPSTPTTNNSFLGDLTTTTSSLGVGTSNYCALNSSSVNGSSSLQPNKKVKMNHIITNPSNDQKIMSTATATNTVMSALPTILTMPSSQSQTVHNTTNTTTAGQPGPFRFPLHMSMNFQNGLPMNLVPFVTSQYCSMPFLNNNPNNIQKNINIPSLLSTNPYSYLDFAQLQSINQSLQNNNGNNNSSLDLSVSKMNSLPTISSNSNGTTTIIVPHSIQSSAHLQSLQAQPQHNAMLNSNNNSNLLNSLRVEQKPATTTSSNEHYIQMSSTEEVPSVQLMGDISNNNNNISDITNSKSHSPNTKLNQGDNGILHSNGKSTNGNGGLSKVKLNFFESLPIVNNLTTTQNLMIKSLGVNSSNGVVTKTPRKSAPRKSPTKIDRGISNLKALSSTPEKITKCPTPTPTNTGTVEAQAPTATETSVPHGNGLDTKNEKVNELISSESVTPGPSPNDGDSAINGNSVTLDNTISVNVMSANKLEEGHEAEANNDDEDLTSNCHKQPDTPNDNVSSSGSDEFAMQIDEDADVHNVNSNTSGDDESTQNTNIYNNVEKESLLLPVANNNNNNVSQDESSSTTTTTTSA